MYHPTGRRQDEDLQFIVIERGALLFPFFATPNTPRTQPGPRRRSIYANNLPCSRCPSYLPDMKVSIVMNHADLQLIMAAGAAAAAQVRHGHELDHQAGPAGKVLRPLALARFGVVLLPCEAGLLPAVVDGVHDVLAQAGVQISRLRLVGPILGGEFLLDAVSHMVSAADRGSSGLVRDEGALQTYV